MAGREKGVATAPCPTCSQDLPIVDQRDGSVSTASCSTCHPRAGAEKASEEKPRGRERGTPNANAVVVDDDENRS